MEEALRYNEGKRRLDLVPTSLVEGVADVLGFGAIKYDENNWRKGMKWSKVIASLERHLLALKKGEDYDPESGLLHVDHIACNTAFLKEYYTICPQYDDRIKPYLARPKIGLDIDEVLCNWVEPWCKKFGYDRPNVWNFSYENGEHFKALMESGEFNEFYANLPRLVDPNDIPFEPHCYITSRSVPVEVTKGWLQKNGFPTAPVYSVGFGESKVKVAQDSGLEIYVDDRYENFLELNKAGICTYLWDAPHNKRYDVGYRRIKSFKDLV